MTDKQLDELLDELNSNPDSSKFMLIQIAADIYFGKVWFNLPWENQIEDHGDNYYFINRPDYGLVGIIEATRTELHVYLKPEFRRKGIMSTSLRETILPHSFWYYHADKLRITIDQDFHGKLFKQVEKSAHLAGFKDKNIVNDRLFEYFAYKTKYPEFELFEGKKQLIAEKEIRFLFDRINSINAQLQYMKERYELLFNEDDTLVSAIRDSVVKFEGMYENKLRSLL